jgi:hypothetical protein
MDKDETMVSYLTSNSQFNGVWVDISKSTIKHMIESNLNPELVKGSYIDNIVPLDEDNFLIHWKNRFFPFDNNDYEEEYGKSINIEELRNKLGPFKNLITMLENGLVEGTIDTHQLVLDEIRICKQNLDELLK